MANQFRQIRKHIYPRAGFSARGQVEPMRASDIILGLTLVMLLVALLASAIPHFFAT